MLQRNKNENVIARNETPHLSLRVPIPPDEAISKLEAGSTISKDEIPRGVYPERKGEILHFVQND